MCSTKALLVGDSESVSNIFRQRVMASGHGTQATPYGWDKAYGK